MGEQETKSRPSSRGKKRIIPNACNGRFLITKTSVLWEEPLFAPVWVWVFAILVGGIVLIVILPELPPDPDLFMKIFNAVKKERAEGLLSSSLLGGGTL